MLQQTQVSRVDEYYPRFLERYPDRAAPGRGAHPARCGRAGKGWATTGARPTCTGWRRSWSAGDGRGDSAETEALRRSPASGATPPARWRASPSSRPSRRWTPTWPGCSAAPSIPGRRGAQARRDALGDRRPARSPRRRDPAWAFNQAIMELGALVCTARVAKCGCARLLACAVLDAEYSESFPVPRSPLAKS